MSPESVRTFGMIMHGTLDKATLPAGGQFFDDTAGSKDKTLKLYEVMSTTCSAASARKR